MNGTRQRSERDQVRFEIAAAICRHRVAEQEAEILPPGTALEARRALRLPSTIWPKSQQDLAKTWQEK